MPRKRDALHDYVMTSVSVRSDLLELKKSKRWNMREILESALLAMVTPEDLAYLENIRLEKQLSENKKILEQGAGDVKL